MLGRFDVSLFPPPPLRPKSKSHVPMALKFSRPYIKPSSAASNVLLHL